MRQPGWSACSFHSPASNWPGVRVRARARARVRDRARAWARVRDRARVQVGIGVGVRAIGDAPGGYASRRSRSG